MDERSRRIARRFEPPMLVLSVLVIPTLILELSDPGQPWDTLAAIADWVIWLGFLAELVTMLAVVPDRRGWLLRHPIEVIVVVLSPPFLAPVFRAFGVLRLFGLLRLLRLAPLAKFAFSLDGLRYAALVTALVVLAGAAAFDASEPASDIGGFGDALYLAVNVTTTLGFGPAPTTDAGKAVAVVLVFTGASFLALLTGSVAERFTSASRRRDDRTGGVATSEAALVDEVRALGERLAALEAALRRASSREPGGEGVQRDRS